MRFEFDLGLDDRALLRSFFEQLRKGFDDVIIRGRWGNLPIRFYGEGGDWVRGALREVESEWDIIESAIDNIGDRLLRRYGLAKQSLRAKLYYIGYWSDQASHPTRFSEIWDAIRRVLENINIVLESFFAATGVGEILKELKDVILNNSGIDG